MSQVPKEILESALSSQRLLFLDTSSETGEQSTTRVLRKIEELLRQASAPRAALRISVPSLGSPHWGDLSSGVSILHERWPD